MVGSIAGADASATTYVVACTSTASPSAADACGFGSSETIVQGPLTYHWVLNEPSIHAGLTVDCVFSGTAQAVCSQTDSGSTFTVASSTDSAGENNGGQGLPAVTTSTLSGPDFPSIQEVVITAGLSNLKATGASGTGSAATGISTRSATTGGSDTASRSDLVIIERALAKALTGALVVGFAAVAL